MVPAIPERAASERLHLAVVALLEPLIDDTARADTAALLASLDAGLAHAEDHARAAAQASLARYLSLSRLYLDLAVSERGWEACREAIENWIGSLVAYSAGHLSGDEVGALFTDLAAVMADEKDRSARAESGPAAMLRAELQELLPALAGGEAASGPSWEAAPLAAPAPPTVARDELEMLAQALDALDAELGAGAQDSGAWPATDEERLELAAERLNHWANAAEFVGIDGLAQLARKIATSLSDQLRASAAAANAQPATRSGQDSAFWRVPRVRAVSATLAQLLRTRGMPQVRALCALLSASDHEPPLDSAWVFVTLESLLDLQLVSSRQVQAPVAATSAEDLSLTIPSDIDPQVLAHLLRELPPLTNALGAAVAGMLAGQASALGDAQRLAHTLKGSANTAGIRGIATLAHLLEDLLSLLTVGDAFAASPSAPLLEQAADALGEMVDALGARAEPPANALALCHEIAETVHRMLDQGSSPTQPLAAGAVAAPDSVASPARPRDESPDSLVGPEPASHQPAAQATPGTDAQVPERMADVDTMLELAAEASVLMAQAQDQLARLQETRRALRRDSERLQDLAAELDRVVDWRRLTGERAVASSAGTAQGIGPDTEHFDDLQTVSRRIAEAGADSRLSDRQLDQQMGALAEAFGQLERVQSDLRDALLASRMVPVSTVVPRLQRALRQAARMAGRSVDLQVQGADVLVDARLLQSLIDPLTHLLRNAADHGIEDEAQRLIAGKPVQGKVQLVFEQASRELRIACIDDGRGLDTQAVLARARQQGMLSPEAGVPDAAGLADLVLRPGFSTRTNASQLSGRGIGMDLVRQALDHLHGSITLASEPGRGLRVNLSMPLAVTGLPVLVLRSRSHVLALSVRQVAQILPSSRLSQADEGGDQLITEEGVWPIRRLDTLLGIAAGALREPPENTPGVPEQPPLTEVVLLVRGNDGRRAALVAPEPTETRRVVLRPLPAWMPMLAGVEGACVLGDGSAAPVIDLPRLLAVPEASGVAGHHLTGPPPAAGAQAQSALAQPPLCLVVDDSLSVRQSTEHFLHDLGLRTDVAGDGVDALTRMRRQRPDLLIVDLEMPRMNGIELVRSLRAEPQWRDLPVIMITSRASVRHRQLALATGVNVFLTKPHTEDDLAAHIRACLEPGSALG